MQRRKQKLTPLIAGFAAVLALASCGQAESPADPPAPGTTQATTPDSQESDPQEGDDITLRVAWWGSDDRANRTIAVLEQFEADNPGVTIVPESQAFDGYLDKLATQVVSGNPPDVIQFPVEAVLDYGERGILATLDDLDYSKVEETTLAAAQIDGTQVAVPTALSTGVVVANKSVFDEAGVGLPDDATWTWDDYSQIAAEISDATENGTYGSNGITAYMAFGTVMRQQGEGKGLHGFDEPMLFGPEDVTEYFNLTVDLIDNGGAPDAAAIIEDASAAPEQTLMAQNRAALSIFPASLYTSLVSASGSELVPLRMPAWPGDSGNHHMALSAPQYWGVTENSEHQDMAKKLVEYLMNDVDAGKELLVSRGTPVNADVREAIADLLDPAEAELTAFLSEIIDEMVPVPLPPAGSNQFQAITQRHLETVIFGTATAEEAGVAMVAELEQELLQ